VEFQFPKKRRYPVALVTFLFYLVWYPLGDFAESLFLGWSIVPCQTFTKKFWTWWWPFARPLNESYLMAFFGYFIPVTGLSYFYLFFTAATEFKKERRCCCFNSYRSFYFYSPCLFTFPFCGLQK